MLLLLLLLLLFVGCLTSQQHASVSQGRICLTSQQHASVSQGRICRDNCTCCHTDREAAGPTCHVTQSQHTELTVSGNNDPAESGVCLLVGCLTSQQHASVSQGRICTDNFTCCHTEIEVADPTFYLTQSQYTDTGPTSPSADPITPGAWQGSHWSANFEVTGMTRHRKNPGASRIRTRDLPLSRLTPYH